MTPGATKLWWTAAELAEARLPGLATTKRKINERAAAEGWALRTSPGGAPFARPRQARGGGLEYHLDALPAGARAAIGAAGVSVAAEVHATPPTTDGRWRAYEAANAKAKAEAARRLTAVQLVEAFEAAGLTRTAAVAGAAGRAGAGKATIWSWLELIAGVPAADRLAHLLPQRRGGGAAVEVDPAAWQFLLSDFLRPEQPTFTACWWRMKRDFCDPRGIAVPIERTLRRKLEREVDGRLIIARREGAEALRRSIPAQQRSVAELHALEAVNIDGHRFDVFVKWPDGRIGRPMMVTIQDLYSRKIVAHRIDESENALATRLVFYDLFRTWGIPRACLLDNGRAFAAKPITGGARSRYRFKIRDEDPTGILPALGIAIHWAKPYRGQSKPIERAFRDLCDTIARHPALAGAYTGNKPDAKPENYGTRAVPIEEFRAIVAAGLQAHNARPGRGTEMSRGADSFDDVFDRSYAVAPIGKATPEQLRLAMLTAEDRTCDRETGQLTLEGNRYWAPELSRYAGQKLTVRFDPDDLHGEIHAYDRAGAFICTAPAIAAVGFFDKAAANKKRSLEADTRKAVKRLAEAHELLSAAELAAMIPDHLDPTPVPATVFRPVRHRGQTAAALKAVPEPSQAPLNTPIDRFARAAAKLKLVD